MNYDSAERQKCNYCLVCVYTRECKTNSVKTRNKKTLVKWLFDILSAPRLISFQAEPHAVHNSYGWWMRARTRGFPHLVTPISWNTKTNSFLPFSLSWRKHCVAPSLFIYFVNIENDGTSHRYWFVLAPHSSRTSYIIAWKKKLFYELFRPSHTELFLRYVSSHPLYTLPDFFFSLL